MEPTNNRKTLDYLKRIKKRIGSTDTWCRHAAAVNDKNYATTPRSTDAAKWCVLGAINIESNDRVNWDQTVAIGSILLQKAVWKLFPEAHGAVHWVNDEYGFESIHAVIDLAISEIEKQLPETEQLSFDF